MRQYTVRVGIPIELEVVASSRMEAGTLALAKAREVADSHLSRPKNLAPGHDSEPHVVCVWHHKTEDGQSSGGAA